MAVTVADLKKYLRIDTAEEDDLLESFLVTAENYLSNAITDYAEHYAADEKFQSQADFLKMVIVSEQYNNRDGRNDPRHDFSFVIRSMISQLQYFATSESA